MRIRLSLLLTVAAAAQAQYYHTDTFASYNNGVWHSPTGLYFGGSGLTGDGGYWVSSMTGITGGAEIKATFNSFPGGPWYVSADLWLAANATATSGYRLAFKDGSVTIYDVNGGSSTAIGAHSFTWSGATAVRAIKTAAGIRIAIGSQVLWTPVSGWTGAPGVGFGSGGYGVAITQAQLGLLDTTAPNAITGLTATGSSNQIALAWTGATDNAGGSGLLRYNVYRNGALIGSTTATSYTDLAVSPGTTYTYWVKSEDYHANEGTAVVASASTGPTSGAPELNFPRQTGVRPLGSYWGAAGENIDMRSGNLNFSLPLLKAQGRHGASLGLGLSYNSQNWRRQSSITTNIGMDVGYGYGWRLMAGSVFAVWSSPGVFSHYRFTDATGAEYRLEVNEGGVWWSKEGLYVAYEAGSNRLRFMDGTYWDMTSLAASTEQDYGTRYATRVTDSNGNYLELQYKAGIGQGAANTSARIDWVKDIRSAPGTAYTFTYNADAIPHLTGIAASIPTGENYTLAYTSVTLQDPFLAAGFGAAKMLQSVTATGPALVHAFEYGTNNAGELAKATFPYGGEIQWVHKTYTYTANGQTLREVQTRSLKKQAGAAPTQYALMFEGTAANGMHSWGYVDDPNGISRKVFNYETSNTGAWYYGLPNLQFDQVRPSNAVPRQTVLAWAQDARLNKYINQSVTTIDPGQSYQKVLQSQQTLDQWGNVTQAKTYDFNNTTTPRTTHNFTYLYDGNYAARFLFNRQLTASIGQGNNTPVLYASSSYDAGTPVARTGLALHDTAGYGTTMTTRGNRTGGGINGGYTATTTYDITGFATGGANGSTTTAATPDGKNVAPATITPNGDATKAMSATFNSVYQVTNVSGPNGASTSIGYDANARPSTTTAPHGAVTTFEYFDSQKMKKATTNGRWVKTWMDGFGRTIVEETGHGASTSVSAVATEYDSCGCTPLGKVKRVSRPYVPPASPTHWTTYTYDSQGRVLSVQAADGASTTSYLYQGNTTKVTSPAGATKWKIHEVDAVGNLVKVTEPNPTGGAEYITNYTYDDKNRLVTVSMPRPSGTQTRTFTYDANGKVLTATNPETGTVTNTYDNTTGLLQHKIDAKQNKVAYTYDNHKRVTEIKRYEWVVPFGGSGSLVERPEQGAKFYYDSNPFDGTFSPYLAGRLAVVETYSKRGADTWNAPGGGNTWETMTFREMYDYTASGLMEKKRLVASGRYSPAYAVSTDFLESSYTFDNEGRMTGQTYPGAHDLLGTTEVAGVTYAYGFDAMGRAKTMTSGGGGTNWISDVAYNAAGQPTAIATANPQVNAESRAYNVMGQLTSLTSGSSTFVYNFSTTANDGRITSQTSGGETVSYSYDSLNRLASATGGGWSATYGMDGFGNLLTVTPSGAGPSAMNVTVDPATNRVNGWTYDPNGNVTAMPGGFAGSYDIENRLLVASKNNVSTNTMMYAYGADNRRLHEVRRSQIFSNGDTIEQFVQYWSGQRLGRYKIRWNSEQPNNGPPSSFVFARVEAENVYFGSKPLRLGGETNLAVDRLGSVRRGGGKDYFPYGQENPSVTAGDKEKYATYKHDAATDLSYADQRYYATGAGRFMTADPYRASATAGNPGSWNRYAYGLVDPISVRDSSGLISENPEDIQLQGHIWGSLFNPIPLLTATNDSLFPFSVVHSAGGGATSSWRYECTTWTCEELNLYMPPEEYEVIVSLGLAPAVAPIVIEAGKEGLVFVGLIGYRVYQALADWAQQRRSAHSKEQKTLDDAFEAALRECKRQGRPVPRDLKEARGEFGLAVEIYKKRVAENMMGNADVISYKRARELAIEVLCPNE